MSVPFLDPRNSDDLLARARSILEDIDISPVILNTIDQLVYDLIYETDAYGQACEKVSENEDQNERKSVQSEIADVLAFEISDYAPEYRIAFLLDRHSTEFDLEIALKETKKSISDRAATFLKDVRITDEFLANLNRHVYGLAYDIDAHEQACKEGKKDNHKYQADLAYDIAANVNMDDVQYRIAFLLERGCSERELETEVFKEILPDRARAFLETVDVNDETLKTLDQRVYDVAYGSDAYEQACEVNERDNETYQSDLADKIASEITALDPEYRIAFLLERGKTFEELKDQVFTETAPCP